jgi:tripartite-type tricarboxylate transporter receptor subunit TctC
MFRAVSLVAATVAAIVACAGSAIAQSYPSRTITLIVPFPPGGGNDTIARLVAQGLTNALGQQVVVENRAGANGVIAMRQAAKAAPDGHTLVFANSSSTSINVALYTNPGYDVRRDFTPIGNIAQMGIGIVSHPDFPAKSVSDLVALAKRQPGKLSFGTSPPGSGSHLSAELFKAITGVNVTLVPYKGAAALTTDVLGNHIPVMFSVLPPALGNIQQGKLHVIAVTTPKRMTLLPKAPTVAESGLPGFAAVLRYGLLAPAGTPRPVIDRINAELRKIVGSKEMLDRLAKEGSDPVVSSPEEYAADMVREDELWGPLIRKLGIKVDYK